MKTFKELLPIISNIEVAEGWYVMSISLEKIKSFKQECAPKPGQFISISFPDIMFRRPFAVSAYVPNRSFSILYQVRTPFALHLLDHIKDNATSKMAHLKNDDTIDVMGFHGNSFPVLDSTHTPILIGGGVGLGPLLYFYQKLEECVYNKLNSHSPTLIVGARTRRLLPLELLPNNTQICTDDGSYGFHGTNIVCLAQGLANFTNPVLYFCGPTAMMNAGAQLAATKNTPAYASLDCVMACAMGACVGCVVPIYDSANRLQWKKACVEGTIFNSKDIVWNQITHI